MLKDSESPSMLGQLNEDAVAYPTRKRVNLRLYNPDPNKSGLSKIVDGMFAHHLRVIPKEPPTDPENFANKCRRGEAATYYTPPFSKYARLVPGVEGADVDNLRPGDTRMQRAIKRGSHGIPTAWALRHPLGALGTFKIVDFGEYTPQPKRLLNLTKGNIKTSGPTV